VGSLATVPLSSLTMANPNNMYDAMTVPMKRIDPGGTLETVIETIVPVTISVASDLLAVL
jgi:hypothetical protein